MLGLRAVVVLFCTWTPGKYDLQESNSIRRNLSILCAKKSLSAQRNRQCKLTVATNSSLRPWQLYVFHKKTVKTALQIQAKNNID